MGNCELGVNFYSANDVMTSNYVHHNTRGGYGIYHSLNPVVEGNEFAYNGGDQKAIDSWNVTFRNNFSHHNSATGFWCDGCDGYAIFGSVPTIGNGMIAEGNRVEDNAQYQGVMCEITPRCVIRNNTIKRNAIGVFVSSSHEADVYGNDLEDNFRGIEYFVYCDGLNTAQAIARGWDFYGNNAHDNSVRLTTKAQAGSYASLFSYTGCTSTQAAPYVNNVRQNNFTRNTYHMPDTGSYWYWVGTKSWSQWLALPQDIGGAVTIP